MGKKDIEEKVYFDNPVYFADACNGILFQGVEKILPEELEEAENELIYSAPKKSFSVRVDGMRYWKKRGVNLALIAVEHQSLTDYHMVFRNMLTESIAYHRQWKGNKKRYEKAFSFRNAKELLSGMRQEDKFIPVILIVINWSGVKWEGATNLHEMLDLPDELACFVNNYKLNIFDCHEHENFSMFKSELRVVFEALKTAGNERKMADLLKRFPKIESDTARLIETLLHVKFDNRYLIKDEEGKVWCEVCKAWDDHFISGKEEGIKEGIKEGKQEMLI